MTPRSAALACFGALLALGPAGCSRDVRRPNVLLVTIDTLRADHCSGYGYRLPTTPRLDRLGREGTRFAAAYAPMATTAPSHATLLTSLYPLAHRVLKNGHALAAEHETLAEIVRARGYETAAIVSSFVLHGKFALGQGFEVYDDDFSAARPSMPVRKWQAYAIEEGFDRRAAEATSRAVRWLTTGRAKDRPFFLWVHYFDPHSPYDPPRRYRDAFQPAGDGRDGLAAAIAAYDGEVRFTDEAIGWLLDAVDREGLRESTLVVATADHGEGLMQHGHMEHGLMLYEEAVRVPLVLRWPGRILAARTVAEPVGLVDVTPTVLDLLGVQRTGTPFQGTSFAPVLEGRAKGDPERAVFLQRRQYEPGVRDGFRVNGEKWAVRAGQWKYIEALEERTRELYDLGADPGELQNRIDRFPERARVLSTALTAWRSVVTRSGSPPPGISPEDAEKLRALGYVQ